MANELAVFTPDQVNLIRGQIAVGCSDDEILLFLHVCKSRGLDPFARQIWAIRRRSWDPIAQMEVTKMTIQTSIDGFRLIAKRAGLDAIDEPEFTYDATQKNGLNPLGLVKATVRIWPKGASRPTVGVAYWDEYRQVGKKGLTGQWGNMPRTMLAKCGEALALRRGCPEELSGLYTSDEMEQSQNGHEPAQIPPQATVRQVATKSAPLLAAGQVDSLCTQLAAAVTPEEFAAIAKSAATLPPAERDVIRARFKARKAAIAQAPAEPASPDSIPEPSAPVSEELPMDMSPDEAHATAFGLAIERADSVTDLEATGNEIRAAKELGFVPPKSLSAAYREKMRELAERDLS